eukprot:15459251-Alexandrium_andersonii.AAC.1
MGASRARAPRVPWAGARGGFKILASPRSRGFAGTGRLAALAPALLGRCLRVSVQGSAPFAVRFGISARNTAQNAPLGSFGDRF